MKITKEHIFGFAIGLIAMFLLDMAFHFNPKTSQFEKDAKRAGKKIENLFNK